MKKNIQINLCGRLYQIDEDAYELLSHYTDTLRNYFMKQEGGSEIADDIEQRIAELFDEQIAGGSQAITIENVQSIINQIGDLKDITEGDAQTSEKSSANNEQKQKAAHLHEMLNKKKYYRDTYHSVLFGVLSGAAHYIGTGANTLRWLFALLCIGWFTFSTLFSILFGGPVFVLFIPLAFVPEVIYFVLGLCIPAATTPEDSLRMKGVPVTPQNLTSEVKKQNVAYTKKSDVSGWNIFMGIVSIVIAFFTAINFIGCIITTPILYTVFSNEIPIELDGYVNPAWTMERTTFFTCLIIACVAMILSVGIVLYCSIHSSLSSFKKAKPMGNVQRILWVIGWVVTITVSIVFIISSVRHFRNLDAMINEAHHAEYEVWQKEHTREDGFYHSDEEWEFLQAGHWNVVVADEVDDNRCTYTGDYIDGDRNTRYLDVYCDGTPARVLIQRMDSLEPGTYRLTAAVKANNDHKFVFALLGNDDQYQLAEIPVYDDEGGTIHEMADWMLYTPVDSMGELNAELQLAVDLLSLKSRNTLRKIAEANWEKGNGWSYVAINDLVVTKPTSITYGITTLEDITGVEPTTGWFSATDFMIEKMDGKSESTVVKDKVENTIVEDKVTSGKVKKRAARRHR